MLADKRIDLDAPTPKPSFVEVDVFIFLRSEARGRVGLLRRCERMGVHDSTEFKMIVLSRDRNKSRLGCNFTMWRVLKLKMQGSTTD